MGLLLWTELVFVATATEPVFRTEANVAVELSLTANRTYGDPFNEVTSHLRAAKRDRRGAQPRLAHRVWRDAFRSGEWRENSPRNGPCRRRWFVDLRAPRRPGSRLDLDSVCEAHLGLNNVSNEIRLTILDSDFENLL